GHYWEKIIKRRTVHSMSGEGNFYKFLMSKGLIELFLWLDIGCMRNREYNWQTLVSHPEVVPLPSILIQAREKPTELSTTWVDKTRHACYVAGASMAGTVAAWPEFFEAFKLTIDGYVDRGLCIGEDQAVIQTTCTRHLSLCRFVLPGQMQGDPWFGMLWALHHGVNVDTL
ncbi:hypothetical protein CYMTET_25807, partial [Cymbomonas tetramitiformis]